MKITVELSDNELREVMHYSGERKKGPAIRKFITTELMLKRRRRISQKVLAGRWNAELPALEHLRKDRDLWAR